MVSDEDVPIEVDASPSTWDPDDNALGSAGNAGNVDDVTVRWEQAADSNGYGAAHDNQKSNGLDH